MVASVAGNRSKAGIDPRNVCGLALFGLIMLIVWTAIKFPERS